MHGLPIKQELSISVVAFIGAVDEGRIILDDPAYTYTEKVKDTLNDKLFLDIKGQIDPECDISIKGFVDAAASIHEIYRADVLKSIDAAEFYSTLQSIEDFLMDALHNAGKDYPIASSVQSKNIIEAICIYGTVS